MCKPESVVQKFRLVFLGLWLAAVAAGCSSSDEDCQDDCTDSVVASQSNNIGLTNLADTLDRTDANSETAASLSDVNQVIVVTGQSNVEAADTDDGFDTELDKPHNRVFAFTDSGWQIADLHQVWDEHAHPGNHSLTVPGRQPNNSFAFHFGKSLAHQDASAVPAFIVLAAPGNGIAHWDYESEFFLKMRAKINSALAQLPGKDTIDVMLWHQGESDWLYEGTSDIFATEYLDDDSEEYKRYYQLKLQSLINNFRSESWARADLPFICAETLLGVGVNRRLMELNDNGDPNSGCVTATDLPSRLSDPSGSHFSAVGLRELGRRYMQKYLMIINR